MPHAIATLFLALLAAAPSAADESAGEALPPPELGWIQGPGTATIGDELADLDLGENFIFLGADDSQRLLERMGNPVAGNELAVVAPAEQDASWFLVFEWDAIGWVDDAERDDLDAEALLASIRKGTEAANQERLRRGWATMEILGWHEPPHYDAETNHLTWAVLGRSQGDTVVNRMVKLLGRRGVMSVTLVSSQDELPLATVAADDLLEGYRFRDGQRYAQFVPGKDDIATIGLAALVAGGAGAALVKSGLLARFWKLIAGGVIAAVAALRGLFGRRRHDERTTLPS